MERTMNKPLAGIRILDLTHMLSGPYGAMILADLGAETIKVEPLKGEGTRKLLATDPNNSLDGQGAYYITLNRNKQSVSLDLKSEEGLEIFYDLVRNADVVIENFSAGVAAKLKISYDFLKAMNPRIITCSISGFGSAGPNFQRPAFDQVVQALGGGMSITGTDSDNPTRAGIPIGDLGGGMFGAMGILSALVERDRSGEGQHVDISMLDCQISMLNYMATMYFLSGEDPHPIGNAHFVHVPYNSYRTSDGHIIIAVIFDSFWDNLLEVIDYEPFRIEKYKTQPGRLEDKAIIEAKLNELLATNTSDYWITQLEAKRIPCAKVNQFSEALSDEQVLSRNMVVDLKHPNGNSTRGPGNPIKLSRTDEESFSPAPLLGQDTDSVLTDVLGYSAEKIEALRSDGFIV
ncbi:L-carnitine dehydratase/bile acid-inducible protein F [Luminiphilus syltensis NOR5-1B]|uniref:L-carnitine dehydratase/bile acid-inducible protein F n=2 Tax=Luminiphilus TaxID=1341118 RepID=B8KU03_9GAMM|nr:L-carnitine dehydratase/bile acid-inducible protein F [Luminiphilus syltensis NOR5-1B]